MIKRMIFHIPLKLDSNIYSGSQIRPIRMIEAFQELGFIVDVVMGSSRERKKQISLIKKKIRAGLIYNFIYSESSTMPTALTDKHHLPLNPMIDFYFFDFCRYYNIPIGLFYRDIYWVFDDYKDNMPFIKRNIAMFFYRTDLNQYNRCLDVLFLPSLQMIKHLPIKFKKRIIALPPGIYNKSNDSASFYKGKGKLSFIYVGGISSIYDLSLFSSIIDDIGNIPFNLCTRKKEWNNIAHVYEKYKSVNVHHKNGNELDLLYAESSIAVYFIKPDELWSFAIGLKLFEYLAHRKPIIAVKGTAVGDFVLKNNIGWVLDFDEIQLKKLIEFLQNNPADIEDKIKNINRIAHLHTWKARALQVSEALSE